MLMQMWIKIDLNICATDAWNQMEYVQLVIWNVPTCTMGVLGHPMQADDLDSGEALSLEILESTTWTETKTELMQASNFWLAQLSLYVGDCS